MRPVKQVDRLAGQPWAAPETRWQAGRLPQSQRRKLLQVNYLCHRRQPANPPWKLAGWQAGSRAALFKTSLLTAPAPFWLAYAFTGRTRPQEDATELTARATSPLGKEEDAQPGGRSSRFPFPGADRVRNSTSEKKCPPTAGCRWCFAAFRRVRPRIALALPLLQLSTLNTLAGKPLTRPPPQLQQVSWAGR